MFTRGVRKLRYLIFLANPSVVLKMWSASLNDSARSTKLVFFVARAKIDNWNHQEEVARPKSEYSALFIVPVS